MRAALLPRVAHLAVDLRLAEHHRVEAARHAEEVRAPPRGRGARSRAPTRPCRRRAAPTAHATRRVPRRRPIRRDRSRCGCRSTAGRSRAPPRPIEAGAAPPRSRSLGRRAARERRASAPRWFTPTTVSAIRRASPRSGPTRRRSQNSSPTSVVLAVDQRSRSPRFSSSLRKRASSRTAAAYRSSNMRPRRSRMRAAAVGTRPVVTATVMSPARCTAGVMQFP